MKLSLLSLLSCGLTILFLTSFSLPLPTNSETITLNKQILKDGTVRRFYDASHEITPDLPVFESPNGTGKFIRLVSSIAKGDSFYSSEFKLSTHTGTHVDAPSHFYQEYFEQGFDVTTLDLATLNGPALVVNVPRNKNITAEVMAGLKIPRGIHRVLFRTLNTYKRLMHQKKFDSSFVGFKADGAEWLVKNTNIKLVGLDYLSVAAFTDGLPVHKTFLKNREIILVEGLNLDKIKTGMYDLHCLPLKIAADGCPARCILTQDVVSKHH